MHVGGGNRGAAGSQGKETVTLVKVFTITTKGYSGADTSAAILLKKQNVD